MVLDVCVISKPGGSTYSHVTFIIKAADGYYEFGFYGEGKTNESASTVTIDRYDALPAHRKLYSQGQTSRSLQELIDQANTWRGRPYNLVTQNCSDHCKMLCVFAGVPYPARAALDR